jgi:hypothetical protein
MRENSMPMMDFHSIRVAFALCAVGCVLHAVTALGMAAGGLSFKLVVFFLYSCCPYAVAAGLIALNLRFFKPPPVFAIGFAVGSLFGDLYMIYHVFIVPKHSSAALGLLVMPFWNLAFIGPAAGALVSIMYRLLGPRHA